MASTQDDRLKTRLEIDQHRDHDRPLRIGDGTLRKTARERLAERDARARSELLDALFEPWIGAGNNPALQARLGAIEPRDAKAVSGALTGDIVPIFEGMTLETQGRIRTALSVLSEGDGEEFRTYWLELPPPFGPGETDPDLILPVLRDLLAPRRGR